MLHISIIVPVYKVEKYLRRCLDSIVAQTFTDWECILIDDGSPDNSGKICDEYAGKDGRFRVFHQENAGTSATRESALHLATGDYIQFVDSDDWIESNMLECMLQKAMEADADIVGCNFVEELNNQHNNIEVFYTSKDAFLKDVLSNYWGVLWKLLIRKKIIIDNQIHFPAQINGGEDYVFVTKCLWYSKKIVCTDKYLYHYNRCNTESFISTSTLEKLMFQFQATQTIENFLIDKNELRNYDEYLSLRKIYVKRTLLRSNFFSTFKLWPSIDKKAVNSCKSSKSKLLFFLSFMLNKLFK